MKPIHYLQLILLAVTVFALSCARQTTPTGGPKDSIPPIVENTIPAKQETNFKGTQIEATFSEAVQLNNPKEQIIISPGVGKDFQAVVHKNKVVITLTNALQPNTTYTVNFREAVQDITEKNPAADVHFAFSTGTYIDSLHIFGNTYELLTGTPGKTATVGLYEADTFNIFKHKPPYFTRADPEGTFHLDNLKPGSYHAYAWNDNNKNLIVDSKSEPYAFWPEIIQPQDTTFAITLPMVRIDSRPLRLTSARPSQSYFNLKTSKSTETFTVISTDYPLFAAHGDDTENIRIYNTMQLPANDSLSFRFFAEDSLSQSIDTTLYLKFSEREIKPSPFQYNPEAFTVSATSGLLHGKLIFNKPVLQINHDSLFYRIDTLQVIPITPADIQYDTTRTIITITKQISKNLLQPKTAAKTNAPQTRSPPAPTRQAPGKTQKKLPNPYELYMAPGTFISAERDSSKASTLSIKPSTMETTGVIILTINTKLKPLIVELVSKNKVVRSQQTVKKVTFSDLQPGDYTLRVIVDSDNNGRWSPGNFFKNVPPESIHFYKKEDGTPTISLKANWEWDLLITF